MPGVIGIVQARMGSRRLPGKILAPLAGRPLLELLRARLATARVDEWWLATSVRPEDDVTEAWGHSVGFGVYRGDSENVLSRFTAIIRERRPDWIVRITGDDPFTDGAAVNRLLDARDGEAKGASLLTLGRSGELPLGYSPQLAAAEAVLSAESEIPDAELHHRAHVLSWLECAGGPVEISLPAGWPARPEWRWTVDTREDLAMARGAFELFGLCASRIGYPEMVALLDLHPEIADSNRCVAQKVVTDG